MTFPIRLRYNKRGKPLATIYRKKSGGFTLYWRQRRAVDGKPATNLKDFASYREAKRAGDKVVADLAKNRDSGLTPAQTSDAVAAFKVLRNFYVETGKDISLIDAAGGYCGALRKLKDRPLTVSEAIDAYLSTVATVKRKDLAEAVKDWIAGRQPKTVAKEGKRPQLSKGYHYNCGLVLKEFAATFPDHAVCDLGKQNVDLYMAAHAGLSPKSRNERRGTIKLFLNWCAAKDFIPRTHALFEADGMTRELTETAEVEPYVAAELQSMLDRASKVPAPPKKAKEGEEAVEQPEADYRPLLPVVALIALGGIRLGEAVRMTWEDVWRIEGHIEVTAGKAKTRSRRLSTLCPALASWLGDFRDSTGPLWTYGLQHFHKAFERMLAELEIPVRRNALRHGFVSAHYALHADEGLSAKEAGNSPAMVHKNYKGLMTKKQGEAWFAVAPARPDNVVQLSTKLATLPIS